MIKYLKGPRSGLEGSEGGKGKVRGAVLGHLLVFPRVVGAGRSGRLATGSALSLQAAWDQERFAGGLGVPPWPPPRGWQVWSHLALTPRLLSF